MALTTKTKEADGVSKGAELIVAERERQMMVEGWTPAHDAKHIKGDLALAAAAYATGSPVLWPWGSEWYKPKDRMSDLVRAGALIAAEIDRLLNEKQHGPR